MTTKRIFLPLSILLLTGCQGTWLMYDTGQQDHLYFMEKAQVHTASFAMVADNDMTVSTTVYLMGQPQDRDRTFTVEYLDAAAGEVFVAGGTQYPVLSARPGTDFSLGELVLPAGAVSTRLDIKLHRTPEMLGGNMVRVGIRLSPNDQFLVCAPDSTRNDAVIGSDFILYVNDGEPACPSWWRDGASALGWHWDLGKFYPEKYRRMLEYFHATEQTNPSFYQFCVAAYGYYLDDPDPAYYLSDSGQELSDQQKKTNMMNTFWRKAYATAWATQVFLPLYEYYKAYNDANPDNPNWEPMGLGTIDRGKSGWSDPRDPMWGFLN